MKALSEEDSTLASASDGVTEDTPGPASESNVPSLSDSRALEYSLAANAVDNSLYHIKWIKYQKDDCPVVTQNENGPCPLIAIINVLLLRKTIDFSKGLEYITTTDLMKHLGQSFSFTS